MFFEFIYILLFILVISYSLVIIIKSKNNFIIIGAIFGLIYFNILPFLIFIINDGTQGLGLDSTSKWAVYSNVRNHPEQILYYFLVLFVILISINFVAIIIRKKKNYLKRTNGSIKQLLFLTLVFIVLYFFKDSYIPDDIHNWAKRAAYFNEQYGLYGNILNVIILSLQYYILIISFNLFEKKFNFIVLFLLFLGVIDTLLTSNRIFFFFFFLLIFYKLFEYKKYIYIISGIFTSIPLIFIMTLWPYIRSSVSSMSYMEAFLKGIEHFELNTSVLNYFIFSMTEGADFLVSYTIVHDFPNIHSFYYGETIFKIFTFYIPRSIWENKWDSIAIKAAQLYDPNISGFSLNTTFVGELYANLGLVGVFLFSFVILLLLNKINLFLNNLKNITFDTSVFFFAITFQIMRSNFSDMFLIVVFVSTIIMILSITNIKNLNWRKKNEK